MLCNCNSRVCVCERETVLRTAETDSASVSVLISDLVRSKTLSSLITPAGDSTH